MDPMDDNDDIFRYIDEESDVECADEITRLKRKRKGFRAAFTGILNIIDRLITASRGADNRINRSEDNRLAIQKAFEKLEQRFDKMEKVNHRILTINRVQDDDAGYQEAIKTAENQYMQRIDNWGQLRIAMLPNPNQQQGAGNVGEGRNLRPVEALKPSFTLTFDNSPTELSTCLAQFKSNFEASRPHTLPRDQ